MALKSQTTSSAQEDGDDEIDDDQLSLMFEIWEDVKGECGLRTLDHIRKQIRGGATTAEYVFPQDVFKRRLDKQLRQLGELIESLNVLEESISFDSNKNLIYADVGTDTRSLRSTPASSSPRISLVIHSDEEENPYVFELTNREDHVQVSHGFQDEEPSVSNISVIVDDDSEDDSSLFSFDGFSILHELCKQSRDTQVMRNETSVIDTNGNTLSSDALSCKALTLSSLSSSKSESNSEDETMPSAASVLSSTLSSSKLNSLNTRNDRDYTFTIEAEIHHVHSTTQSNMPILNNDCLSLKESSHDTTFGSWPKSTLDVMPVVEEEEHEHSTSPMSISRDSSLTASLSKTASSQSFHRHVNVSPAEDIGSDNNTNPFYSPKYNTVCEQISKSNETMELCEETLIPYVSNSRVECINSKIPISVTRTQSKSHGPSRQHKVARARSMSPASKPPCFTPKFSSMPSASKTITSNPPLYPKQRSTSNSPQTVSASDIRPMSPESATSWASSELYPPRYMKLSITSLPSSPRTTSPPVATSTPITTYKSPHLIRSSSSIESVDSCKQICVQCLPKSATVPSYLGKQESTECPIIEPPLAVSSPRPSRPSVVLLAIPPPPIDTPPESLDLGSESTRLSASLLKKLKDLETNGSVPQDRESLIKSSYFTGACQSEVSDEYQLAEEIASISDMTTRAGSMLTVYTDIVDMDIPQDIKDDIEEILKESAKYLKSQNLSHNVEVLNERFDIDPVPRPVSPVLSSVKSEDNIHIADCDNIQYTQGASNNIQGSFTEYDSLDVRKFIIQHKPKRNSPVNGAVVYKAGPDTESPELSCLFWCLHPTKSKRVQDQNMSEDHDRANYFSNPAVQKLHNRRNTDSRSNDLNANMELGVNTVNRQSVVRSVSNIVSENNSVTGQQHTSTNMCFAPPLTYSTSNNSNPIYENVNNLQQNVPDNNPYQSSDSTGDYDNIRDYCDRLRSSLFPDTCDNHDDDECNLIDQSLNESGDSCNAMKCFIVKRGSCSKKSKKHPTDKVGGFLNRFIFPRCRQLTTKNSTKQKRQTCNIV